MVGPEPGNWGELQRLSMWGGANTSKTKELIIDLRRPPLLNLGGWRGSWLFCCWRVFAEENHWLPSALTGRNTQQSLQGHKIKHCFHPGHSLFIFLHSGKNTGVWSPVLKVDYSVEACLSMYQIIEFEFTALYRAHMICSQVYNNFQWNSFWYVLILGVLV